MYSNTRARKSSFNTESLFFTAKTILQNPIPYGEWRIEGVSAVKIKNYLFILFIINYFKITDTLKPESVRSQDKNYYSVPYIHIGKKVNIFYSQTVVEVFYRYERITHHMSDRTPFRSITVDEHMVYKNRFMTDWTPEKFIERAANVGEDTRKYIISILEKRQHP